MKVLFMFLLLSAVCITAQQKEIKKEDFKSQMEKYNYIYGQYYGFTCCNLTNKIDAESFIKWFSEGMSGVQTTVKEQLPVEQRANYSIANIYGSNNKGSGFEMLKDFFTLGFNDGLQGKQQFFLGNEYRELNMEMLIFFRTNKEKKIAAGK